MEYIVFLNYELFVILSIKTCSMNKKMYFLTLIYFKLVTVWAWLREYGKLG